MIKAPLTGDVTGDWLDIGPLTQIAPGHARTMPVRGADGATSIEIAIFHTWEGEFYALVKIGRAHV